MKQTFCSLFILFTLSINLSAQTCDCGKEFNYIKDFIEHNYPGFKDKAGKMQPVSYTSMVKKLEALTGKPEAKENCLLLIQQYLQGFKDDHIQVQANFDGLKNDSMYINSRRIIPITGAKLEALKHSTGIEGIYHSKYDSSYTIAVIKDETSLHGYMGIMLYSKVSTWKKGMIKFEATFIEDSLMKGILYMRNHVPKVEYFAVGKNTIGGDWRRVGSSKETSGYQWEPVASKKISDSTLYIKIASFGVSNAHNIDSVFKRYDTVLRTTPNLILDLRNNGGGADFAYGPLVPYIYTKPLLTIGVDALATDANIMGWKKILQDPDIPENVKGSINGMIAKMEANKGRLVNIVEDETDSSFMVLAYPKRIAVLINNGCASTTEQFLLYAKQSAKITLVGQHTNGTLDYANMRDSTFPCMPYILSYATTRSRRIDVGQAIDNVGIMPDIILSKQSDWIAEATKMLEAK